MLKWYEKSGPESDVVISTSIRLIRNLCEYPFPARMNRTSRASLIDKVRKAASELDGEIPYEFAYTDMESISRTEAVSLVERRLSTPDFVADSKGRGILISRNESVSIMLNEENHLQMQIQTSGLNLEGAYRTIDALDTLLDKRLHFAFDKNLGYLTQNPVNLGTGMCASLVLHLPALKEGGAVSRISASLSKLGLVLCGLNSMGSEPTGAVYQLSNRVTLGLSEQEAIFNLRNIAMQIISQERSARADLAGNIEVQDIVCRSLGILENARIINFNEFMNLISNIRFGISIELIKNIEYDKIDKLMIEVQPATLLLFSGKQLTTDERHLLRAQIIKDLLISKQRRDENV